MPRPHPSAPSQPATAPARSGRRDQIQRQIEQHLHTPKSGLLWYHRLGELLNALVPYGERFPSDGGGIAALAAAGPSASDLYKARAFAARYSRAEAAALPCPPLTWSKLVYLLTVEDDDTRLQLQRQAIDHAWTYPDLVRAIKRKLHRPRGRSGRRWGKAGGAIPAASLDRFLQLTRHWVGCHDHLLADAGQGHLQALEAMAPRKRTAAVRESLRQLAGELQKVRARLRAVLARVERLAGEPGRQPQGS